MSFSCLVLLLPLIAAQSYQYSVTVSNAKAFVVPDPGVYVQVFGFGSNEDKEIDTYNSNTLQWNENFLFDDNDDIISGAYKYFLFKLFSDSLLGETARIPVSDIQDCTSLYAKQMNVRDPTNTGTMRTLFIEISKMGCDSTVDIDPVVHSFDYFTPQQILNSKTINSYIGFTRERWGNIKPVMHPTQPDVGYAWMIRKVCSDFYSPAAAQSAMMPVWGNKWPNLDAADLNQTGSTLPCIIGPRGPDSDELVFYVIDSHHTLSALDYSGYDDTWIYINILNDFRWKPYDIFRDEMMFHKRTYLYGHRAVQLDLPILFDFVDLPETFGTLGDSTWRSLAGYSRKVKTAPADFPQCDVSASQSEYCMRPFMRICGDDGNGIPFYEFMWGYFYVYATYIDTYYWPDDDYVSLNQFKTNYLTLKDLYYDANGNLIDPTLPEECEVFERDWLNVASLLVPLARSDKTAEYVLPEYFGRDTLPGYIQGPQVVEDDPDCNFNAAAHIPHTLD